MSDDTTNAAPTDRPVNVLLVDDLPANLLVLEAVLDGPGRRLVRAITGEAALRYLAEDDFAVVLLDVRMPGLDGFQTAQHIRAQPRSRHTPIIFVTGYDTEEFPVQAAYELGAVDYLVKPLVPAILRAKVGVFIELARQAAHIRDLEGERVARAAAEAEARRKDVFLATIAHELRNPLVPLRNGIQVLRMAPDAGTVATVVEMLDRQVSHLSHLVDDLLDVARVGQNKLRLRTEMVDLRRAAEMAVEGSRPFLEAAGHRFAVRLADEPVRLVADPARLAQVVSNLLTNAGKYTPRGGDVELVVGVEAREAVVRVRDTGVGIPPAMLPKVFDLFAQVEHSVDHSQGGLGIGLALVKRLVEAHGGAVEARSDGPGTGSEFIVRLPLAAG